MKKSVHDARTHVRDVYVRRVLKVRGRKPTRIARTYAQTQRNMIRAWLSVLSSLHSSLSFVVVGGGGVFASNLLVRPEPEPEPEPEARRSSARQSRR